MKRMIRYFGVLLLFICVLSSAVFADMGPKPSVILKIRGFNATACYVTLLSEDESTGPYSWVGFGSGVYEPPSEDADIWQAFVDYKDEDGYYFLQYFEYAEEYEDRDGLYRLFTWDYYPPDRFKVLLYLPDGDFYISDAIDAYAFESRYEVTVNMYGEPHLDVERSYGYVWEAAAFLVRFCLTVGLEIMVALAFGYKYKRQLIVILGANAVTQLALNIGLLMGGYPSMFLFYVLEYIVWEALIFAAEATLYKLTLFRLDEPYQGNKHPILYAFTANVVSFVMGYVISQWFPFVF